MHNLQIIMKSKNVAAVSVAEIYIFFKFLDENVVEYAWSLKIDSCDFIHTQSLIIYFNYLEWKKHRV